MLLPLSFQKLFKESETIIEQRRVVCDFIAGMTDQYANKIFSRYFLPGEGTVFDRL